MAIAAATAIAGAALAAWGYHSTRRPTVLHSNFAQLTVESGQEREPSISPDAKMFAFVKDLGGQSDIFLQRLDGKSAINLTADNPSNDHEPAFSPDGSQIAFRSERDGGGIFLMGATGESVRRLTDKGFDPAWSPDGRTIVYSSQPAIHPASVFGDADLFVVDVASGSSRVFFHQADVMQPVWSPHGDRVAFWIARKGRRDIMTIDKSGDPASIQDITADDAIDWSPMWSADGRYLYFSSDRDGTMNLWRVAVDEKTGKRDGELEPVRVPSSFAGFFSTSHDGTAFTYQSSVVATEVLRVTFDRKTTTIAADPAPLFTGSTSLRQSMPSPDGKWIVYTNLGPQEDVFVMSSDGATVRQITNDRFFDRGASWWPDGSRVIFYSSRAGVYDAYTIRPDGSGLTKITSAPEGVNYPRVSRDGRRIAYIADDGTGSRIATLDASGRAIATEKMAEVPAGGFRPQAWSPDGKWIAGASWLPTAPIALHL
jgi:Tol biopolymer transport system component